MKKKRILTLEFKIGIFIVCGILVFFFFIFSQGKIFHAKWLNVKVLFSNVAGLTEGDPVRLSGYKIGNVKSINIVYEKINNTEQPEIEVTLNLKPNLKLGHHSIFTIDSTGIVGEKYVEIIPTGLNNTPLISQGETVKGVSPVSIGQVLDRTSSMIENFNTLVSSTNELLTNKKFKSGLYNIEPTIKTFTNKASETLTSINALSLSLKKNSDEIQRILDQNQNDIHQMFVETNKTIKNANNTIKDADITVRDISLASKNISTDAGSFVKTANDVNSLITNLKTTSNKIGALSDNINNTIMAINKEKGTIGELVYDKKLYNELLEFVQEIKNHPSMLLFGK